MAATTTIEVPHLGGIRAGYALSGGKYDPGKPTCVLINSMCTTVSLYKTQFAEERRETSVYHSNSLRVVG
jgi:microsomal epoxide hydrolase